MELNKKAYDEYVKQITPVNELGSDMLHAFVTGGTICALGQASVMLSLIHAPHFLQKTFTSPCLKTKVKLLMLW